MTFLKSNDARPQRPERPFSGWGIFSLSVHFLKCQSDQLSSPLSVQIAAITRLLVLIAVFTIYTLNSVSKHLLLVAITHSILLLCLSLSTASLRAVQLSLFIRHSSIFLICLTITKWVKTPTILQRESHKLRRRTLMRRSAPDSVASKGQVRSHTFRIQKRKPRLKSLAP